MNFSEPNTRPQAPTPPSARQPSVGDFSIEDAVSLMQSLPKQNRDLVVQVVKKTLQSVNVELASIVIAGGRKQEEIEGRIKEMERDISTLELQISTHRQEVKRLRTLHRETQSVVAYMQLADKPSKKQKKKERKEAKSKNALEIISAVPRERKPFVGFRAARAIGGMIAALAHFALRLGSSVFSKARKAPAAGASSEIAAIPAA